jgi:hypothetical protein
VRPDAERRAEPTQGSPRDRFIVLAQESARPFS